MTYILSWLVGAAVIGVAIPLFVFLMFKAETLWVWAWSFVPTKVREFGEVALAWGVLILILTFGVWAVGDGLLASLSPPPHR